MNSPMIEVVFKRGLTATEIHGLELYDHVTEIHLASVGVWQDQFTMQYEAHDDLDFWLHDNAEMVCPLRISALFCASKEKQCKFYIPLLELPVERLVMNIPNWLIGALPMNALV